MADTETQMLPELIYQNPQAALDWLARAFGFEHRMVVSDAAGAVVFAETGLDGRTVAVVPETSGLHQSPLATAGINTQTIQVTGLIDIAAHCERARAAGARIALEPHDTGLGNLYMAVDPEGHIWAFRSRTEGAGALPDGWRVSFPSRG